MTRLLRSAFLCLSLHDFCCYVLDLHKVFCNFANRNRRTLLPVVARGVVQCCPMRAEVVWRALPLIDED